MRAAAAHEENRLGATRHAYAAIAHGRDDAIALSLGGFALGLVAHDREAAQQAVEAALALSPSCALAYIFGSVVMAYAGEADSGIEWGERALRLSPFDPMSYAAVAFNYAWSPSAWRVRGSGGSGTQSVPGKSLSGAWHTSCSRQRKPRSGSWSAAKSAAERVLELQPGFYDKRIVHLVQHPTVPRLAVEQSAYERRGCRH